MICRAIKISSIKWVSLCPSGRTLAWPGQERGETSAGLVPCREYQVTGLWPGAGSVLPTLLLHAPSAIQNREMCHHCWVGGASVIWSGYSAETSTPDRGRVEQNNAGLIVGQVIRAIVARDMLWRQRSILWSPSWWYQDNISHQSRTRARPGSCAIFLPAAAAGPWPGWADHGALTRLGWPRPGVTEDLCANYLADRRAGADLCLMSAGL